ncbi:MAG TPA: patatin-like phospholipase family protein [Dehalococcoidia bacterium]|nr:patatin-like phospholipase family protein [Dehalococcoidia bacterium]
MDSGIPTPEEYPRLEASAERLSAPVADGVQSIGLALGGGGARGFAHIGVLEVFEASGRWRVAELAGTSAGALYAAGYAFGLTPADLLRHARLAPRHRIFRPRPRAGALIGHQALAEWLTEVFGSARIEDCRIPLTIVATRVRDGATVYLREGPLVRAVVASATIPLVFPPVELDGELLVDGGVSLPVPELALRGPWPRVAVDLGPGPLQRRRLQAPRWWPWAETMALRIPHPHLQAGVLSSLRQNARGYQGASGELIIRPAVGSWEDLAYLKTNALVERGRAAARSFLTTLEEAWPQVSAEAGNEFRPG